MKQITKHDDDDHDGNRDDDYKDDYDNYDVSQSCFDIFLIFSNTRSFHNSCSNFYTVTPEILWAVLSEKILFVFYGFTDDSRFLA